MFQNERVRKAKEKLASERPATNINFRLYCDEREAIAIAARNAGKSISAYIRECVFSSLSIPELSKEKKEEREDFEQSDAVESFRRPAGENGARIAENLRENVSNFDEQVEKRTGHRRGCECFACVRLREMVSVQGKKARGRPAKKKVVPLFVV